MTSMSITWELEAKRLARVEVSDEHATLVLAARATTYAPEDLLGAVYDMVCCGEDDVRFVFETETIAYAWLFNRSGGTVAIRVLRLPTWDAPDEVGTELWVSDQPVEVLAEATITCFRQLATRYSPRQYLETWCESFPDEHLGRLEYSLAELQAARRTGGWWCF
ncbi:hypothetical protein [Nocardia thailandica]